MAHNTQYKLDWFEGWLMNKINKTKSLRELDFGFTKKIYISIKEDFTTMIQRAK